MDSRPAQRLGIVGGGASGGRRPGASQSAALGVGVGGGGGIGDGDGDEASEMFSGGVSGRRKRGSASERVPLLSATVSQRIFTPTTREEALKRAAHYISVAGAWCV